MTMEAEGSARPLAGVRRLAELAANQRGFSFVGSDLRLFADNATAQSSALLSVAAPHTDAAVVDVISPFALGRAYELLLAPGTRQKKGAHLTPEAIARNLVAMIPEPAATAIVLDPAVGGAAFLLAAADRLIAAGATASEAMSQLRGVDIDPGAVAVAEAAVALWGADRGVAPAALPQLQCGDGLLDDLATADCVVGNPPFLNQLRATSSHSADRRAALRDRWGDLVGTYTDDAWLFVAAGLDTLVAGGVLAMVQPVSILAARHADAVRRHVHDTATMTGLWVARERVFDAAVQVCGIVLQSNPDRSDQQSGAAKTQPPSAATGPVIRRAGAAFEPLADLAAQPSPDQWGSAAAAAIAVPPVQLPSTSPGTVGDLASATAGFRDQFYGFVPFVSDGSGPVVPAGHARLVTVGMIDMLALEWGNRSFKFAKQDFTYPLVDLVALQSNDPGLYEWTTARRRAKLLMATQTRVVEVWVDVTGEAIPATPVLSIEPHENDADTLWLLAAALSAPAISAHYLAANFGTAMSLNAMKLSARDVLGTPLPTDRAAWQAAASLLQSGTYEADEFAQLMGAAYGVQDPELIQWWLDRLPNRS